MKTNFTKHIYTLLFINLLFLTSCDESDTKEIPEPIQQVSCRLTNHSYMYSDGSFNLDFEYNLKGYLVKETMVSKSATYQIIYIKTLMYNANDQLVKYDVTRNGQDHRSVTYEYVNGKVSLEKNYNSTGTLSSSWEYIYGPDNRLLREVGEDGDTREYTYDTNGNLIKSESYSDGILWNKITYENYDTKQNYFRAIKGFYNSSVLTSPNNPGRQTSTVYMNGVVNDYTVTNYSYKYNSDDYPIEVTKTDDQQSYNLVESFNYKCE